MSSLKSMQKVSELLNGVFTHINKIVGFQIKTKKQIEEQEIKDPESTTNKKRSHDEIWNDIALARRELSIAIRKYHEERLKETLLDDIKKLLEKEEIEKVWLRYMQYIDEITVKMKIGIYQSIEANKLKNKSENEKLLDRVLDELKKINQLLIDIRIIERKYKETFINNYDELLEELFTKKFKRTKDGSSILAEIGGQEFPLNINKIKEAYHSAMEKAFENVLNSDISTIKAEFRISVTKDIQEMIQDVTENNSQLSEQDKQDSAKEIGNYFLKEDKHEQMLDEALEIRRGLALLKQSAEAQASFISQNANIISVEHQLGKEMLVSKEEKSNSQLSMYNSMNDKCLNEQAQELLHQSTKFLKNATRSLVAFEGVIEQTAKKRSSLNRGSIKKIQNPPEDPPSSTEEPLFSPSPTNRR